jgi:hypothetical protein
VLQLASDARIQPEGQAEIRQAIASGEHAGYYLPSKNHFLNRWIQHCGWWPDYQLLLFRKDLGVLEPREHGRVNVRGSVGYLHIPQIHYAHRSIFQYVHKTNRYTDAEAGDQPPAGRPFRRQFVVTKMAWNFKKTYWKLGGRHDEMHGLVFCGLMAFYKFLLYAKYWERRAECGADAVGTLSTWVDDENLRTTQEAVRLFENQGRLPLVAIRRQITWGSLRAVIGAYLNVQAIRTGTAGVIRALQAGWRHFLIWAKCWELTER